MHFSSHLPSCSGIFLDAQVSENQAKFNEMPLVTEIKKKSKELREQIGIMTHVCIAVIIFDFDVCTRLFF